MMVMHMRKVMLAGAVALLGMLALSAAPAAAKSGYANICPALGEPALCGQAVSEGIAVDNSSGSSAGDVWVSVGNDYEEVVHLLKFDAAGEQIGEAEVARAGGIYAENGSPTKVAVDPTSGDVYLASLAGGTVTKFDSSGVFQFQITSTPEGAIKPGAIAVDAEGHLYVADVTHGEIDKFSSSGAFIASFPMAGLSVTSALAFGPEGDLYVANGSVRRYSSTGAPVDCPGASNVMNAENVEAIAVDPSDGHVFVVSVVSEPISPVLTERRSVVTEYSAFCAATPSFTFPGKRLEESNGIGVSGSATHEVYVGNVFDTEDTGVRVYGVVTLPSAVTGASASDVTRASAMVSGTVSPEGAEVTSCEFEYGPTIIYGSTAPCSPAPPFSGVPVAVSAELSFLLPPGGAIHYRLKVGSAGGYEYGQDESFVRAAPPTVVGTLLASDVTQFAATLNGMIETGEEVANYHFEYGTSTAYGQVAPIPDSYTPISNEPIPIVQPIYGLQAGTTYHYRLVASSPGGTDVAGPDMTFTTQPVPAPTVATGGSEGVGVGSATLTGTIDPHGWDTTYLFEYGTSTAYGSNWPTVQVDMGALEGPQPVLVNVPNLLPGTTYHYRLVATSSGGTSYGPDMAFTTGEYPAAIVQEPEVLRTLQVPAGENAKPPSSKPSSSKKHKKAKKKRKARHSVKRASGHKRKGASRK
jgi:hypothetical protein